MQPQCVGELHVLHRTSHAHLTGSQGCKGLVGRGFTVPHTQDLGVPVKVSAVLDADARVDVGAAQLKRFKTRFMEDGVAPWRSSCRCGRSPCFSSRATICISPFHMWHLRPAISLPSATSIPATSLSKGVPVSFTSTNSKFQAQWAEGHFSKAEPGVVVSLLCSRRRAVQILITSGRTNC